MITCTAAAQECMLRGHRMIEQQDLPCAFSVLQASPGRGAVPFCSVTSCTNKYTRCVNSEEKRTGGCACGSPTGRFRSAIASRASVVGSCVFFHFVSFLTVFSSFHSLDPALLREPPRCPLLTGRDRTCEKERNVKSLTNEKPSYKNTGRSLRSGRQRPSRFRHA